MKINEERTQNINLSEMIPLCLNQRITEKLLLCVYLAELCGRCLSDHNATVPLDIVKLFLIRQSR